MKILYGIEAAPLKKTVVSMRPKLELLHARPLDTARVAKTDIACYGYRQAIQLPKTNAASVLAVSEAGGPAAVSNRVGKGTAILCGFLPGFAYVRPAIPMWPFGRGGDEDLSAFIPTGYDAAIRSVFQGWLNSAGIVSPVACSEPLVEATLLKGNDGKYRIALVNFTLEPLKSVKVTTRGLPFRQAVDAATGEGGGAAPDFEMPLFQFAVLRLEP